MSFNKKKVLVGMSGGVDSSVTACLLKEQGYEVIGIHLRFWVDPNVFLDEEREKFPQNKCCTLEGLVRTRQVAHKLGIPFYVLNFEEPFKTNVVDFFVEGYGQGITPNPCIECNRTIKFGLFLEKMKSLGADYIATGHYARKRTFADGNHQLLTAKDVTKDQSYFLYTLTQEKLDHVLFPIGEYTKQEVRELARKFNIDEVNHQKESQNLCFFPERTHGPFLKRYLQQQKFTPGPIITREGKIIGQHTGLPNYTIGQRKGLGIGGIKDDDGTPWFVIRLDSYLNHLVVGKEKDLYQTALRATNLSYVSGKPIKEMTRLQAKIRSLFPKQPAIFEARERKNDNEEAIITFEKPQRAITPGQSIVFYDNEVVLGGGIIENTKTL